MTGLARPGTRRWLARKRGWHEGLEEAGQITPIGAEVVGSEGSAGGFRTAEVLEQQFKLPRQGDLVGLARLPVDEIAEGQELPER